MRDYEIKGEYKVVCPFFKSCFNGKYCPDAFTSEIKGHVMLKGLIVEVLKSPPSKCFKRF